MATIIEEPRVDVHKAVKAAIAFFEKSFAHEKVENLQLEEVELSEDNRFWLITLGYDDPAATNLYEATKIVAALRPRPLRKYKVVRVDAENGKAVAVKIR
jgi:hypothetical protein